MPTFGNVIYDDASAFTALPVLRQINLGADVKGAGGTILMEDAGLDDSLKGVDGGIHVFDNTANVGSKYKFK